MDEISRIKASNSLMDIHMDSTLMDMGFQTEDTLFHKEEYFHRLLVMERKRTERSGNPSVLMLIDISKLSANWNPPGTIDNIVLQLICSIFRETDIVGWYKSYSVIGVILSEISGSTPNEAMEMISAKLKTSISEDLEPHLADEISINFESITRKGNWENGYSPLGLCPYDTSNAPGHEHNFDSLLKSFLGSGSFLVLVDLLIVSMAQIAGFWFRWSTSQNDLEFYAVSFSFGILAYFLFFYIFDLYDAETVSRPRESSIRITLSVLSASVIYSLVFYFQPRLGHVGLMITIQAGAAWALLMCWRLFYEKFFQLSKNNIRTLIIGTGEKGESAAQLLASPGSRFEVVGFLDDDCGEFEKCGNRMQPVLGSTRNLVDVISEKGIDAVVLAMENNESPRTTRRLLAARLCGQEVYDLATLFEKVAGRIPVKYVEDSWFLSTDGFHLISNESVRILKRISDFILSGALLLCSLPIMVFTALAIKIDSHGPIFFKQTRIGKGGKAFTVFKFRSMGVNAEEKGAKWAEKKDQRVTRIGGIIRILHIDELPQIWNVFIGDMSLIGPRPERPEFVEELNKQVPYYSVRHTVRPGITGWAQIRYPYGASVEDSLRKLEYDLFYVKNMSFWQDFKIVLQTIGVVILGKGAR